MDIDFSKQGFTAYPSLTIPLHIGRLDILEIRAVIKTDIKQDVGRCLDRVYWVISCGRCLFSKNKTWVQEMRRKTDKFRDKTAFDSFEEATAFAKENWDKVIKPWV